MRTRSPERHGSGAALSARMATFPGRLESLRVVLPRLLEVFPRVYICLNEFRAVPSFLLDSDRIVSHVPSRDLKDAGKFAFEAQPDEIVFLVDDDIIYPLDYVATMCEHLRNVGAEAIVGVHGMRFYWDRMDRVSYRMNHFHDLLLRYHMVDRLGTGTVCLKGSMLPSLEEVLPSSGDVDAGLAALAVRRGWPMVAVPRRRGWLSPLGSAEVGLWDTANRESRAAEWTDVRAIAALGARRDRHRGLTTRANLMSVSKRAACLRGAGVRLWQRSASDILFLLKRWLRQYRRYPLLNGEQP